MVKFDKDIVVDPLDEIEGISKPNEEREGPIVNMLNSFLQKRSGGSYHNTDPKRGHLSASDGCKRRSYLNYIHKLDDDLEPYPNTVNSNWTFKHGDAVHELIQEMLVEELGEEHVTNEETVRYEIDGDFYIYGHADIVIRGINDPQVVRDALPGEFDLLPDGFKGFPDPFVIDIKTKSEFTYYNFGKKGHARTVPSESNMMQLNGYMGILGAKYGALLYYSKRNDHLEEYWMPYDEELFDEAISNITEVLTAVDEGNPAPRDSAEYLCDEKYCAYYREGLCPGVDSVDDPDNWDGNDSRFSYDNPEWS